ncbi:ABC transporter permease [Paenibacillus alvei]|uniref:Multidrug ABC transporter permease n=1 Tax=Paenibacillus alvei TaxID=44250 RepID=A0A383RGF8_PAEAL|nr:ABC transporter permease [Paenibacillus alvei]SYX86185.1 conserved membrane protein of unknown function [Paenibacillus alvei]
MLRSVSAEVLKLRHSRIWIILVVLPVISLVIGCANYYFNREVLQQEWYSLWTQAALFYGMFFLPVLIAICCAYACRLEHMNRNWNAVLTAPVSIASVIIAKLIAVGALLFFVQLIFFTLYFGMGHLLGISSAFPSDAIGWIFRGWISSLAIAAIQLVLSLRIRSFAAPIGICLCAVFLGLGLYVAKFGMLLPYSMLTLGMGVLSQESLNGTEQIQFYVISGIYIVLFTSLAIRSLQRNDVIQA